MKRGSTLILLLFFLANIQGQKIDSIKTDEDCQIFIRKNIENYSSFYFDTIFTKEEIISHNIKDPYRNWGLIDFNADGKMDLYFVGKRKAPYSSGHEAVLYLSNFKGSYDIVYLIRNWISFNPLVFSRTLLSKSLLFIYQISTYEGLKTDSIVAAKQFLYPKGIKAIDTLCYKHGYVINYTKFPSQLKFDSLIYRTNWGATYRIFKNGNIYFSNSQNGSDYIEKNTFSESKVAVLKKLIAEININNTNTDYSIGGVTDQPAVKLRIFDKGKEWVFSDYGMKSTFTLMAIYKVIGSLFEN